MSIVDIFISRANAAPAEVIAALVLIASGLLLAPFMSGVHLGPISVPTFSRVGRLVSFVSGLAFLLLIVYFPQEPLASAPGEDAEVRITDLHYSNLFQISFENENGKALQPPADFLCTYGDDDLSNAAIKQRLLNANTPLDWREPLVAFVYPRGDPDVNPDVGAVTQLRNFTLFYYIQYNGTSFDAMRNGTLPVTGVHWTEFTQSWPTPRGALSFLACGNPSSLVNGANDSLFYVTRGKHAANSVRSMQQGIERTFRNARLGFVFD